MVADKTTTLLQWERFCKLTDDTGPQDRLQFLMTMLGEEKLTTVNNRIESMFGSEMSEGKVNGG